MLTLFFYHAHLQFVLLIAPQTLWQQCYALLLRALQAFKRADDPVNSALLLCNLGKLMRIGAHSAMVVDGGGRFPSLAGDTATPEVGVIPLKQFTVNPSAAPPASPPAPISEANAAKPAEIPEAETTKPAEIQSSVDTVPTGHTPPQGVHGIPAPLRLPGARELALHERALQMYVDALSALGRRTTFTGVWDSISADLAKCSFASFKIIDVGPWVDDSHFQAQTHSDKTPDVQTLTREARDEFERQVLRSGMRALQYAEQEHTTALQLGLGGSGSPSTATASGVGPGADMSSSAASGLNREGVLSTAAVPRQHALVVHSRHSPTTSRAAGKATQSPSPHSRLATAVHQVPLHTPAGDGDTASVSPAATQQATAVERGDAAGARLACVLYRLGRLHSRLSHTHSASQPAAQQYMLKALSLFRGLSSMAEDAALDYFGVCVSLAKSRLSAFSQVTMETSGISKEAALAAEESFRYLIECRRAVYVCALHGPALVQLDALECASSLRDLLLTSSVLSHVLAREPWAARFADLCNLTIPTADPAGLAKQLRVVADTLGALASLHYPSEP